MSARLRECIRAGVAPQLLHAACCPAKGGGSSSANETTTQNIDKRLVVDSGIGISSDSSTLNVSALDGGSIERAFAFSSSAAQSASVLAGGAVQSALEFAGDGIDLLKNADELQGKTAQQLINLADHVFTGAFNVLDKNADIVKSSGANVATAYDNAKGEGDAKRLVAYGVIAAVAIVAVRAFGKGH